MTKHYIRGDRKTHSLQGGSSIRSSSGFLAPSNFWGETYTWGGGNY